MYEVKKTGWVVVHYDGNVVEVLSAFQSKLSLPVVSLGVDFQWASAAVDVRFERIDGRRNDGPGCIWMGSNVSCRMMGTSQMCDRSRHRAHGYLGCGAE